MVYSLAPSAFPTSKNPQTPIWTPNGNATIDPASPLNHRPSRTPRLVVHSSDLLVSCWHCSHPRLLLPILDLLLLLDEAAEIAATADQTIGASIALNAVFLSGVATVDTLQDCLGTAGRQDAPAEALDENGELV